VGQKQPIQILSALIRKQTIPNALLFTGIQGVGKQAVALVFAKAANCINLVSTDLKGVHHPVSTNKNDSAASSNPILPCERCKPCRTINSGNHPDIIVIHPTGADIKIAQIRNLCETLALKPYEAKLRVVIIKDAQKMNPPASNALLKVLEEPPDRTTLILTAEHPSDLLPTILSRCQQLRFKPLEENELTSFLVDDHSIDRVQASIMASLAGGSRLRAESMIQMNWFEQRTQLLNELASLTPDSMVDILTIAERLAQKKETVSEALDIIHSWLRDLVTIKYAPGKIIHKDLTDTIEYASQQSNISRLLTKAGVVQSLQRRLKANINIRLAMEVLLQKLARQ